MQILLEHNNTPGTVYENTLILGGSGCAILNEMDLHESSGQTGIITKFRGKFQEANAINKNKRMYPKDVLDTNVKSLQECIASGGLIGELDHPTDSIIHFTTASHKITKLWWENNVLMGEGVILNTPHGKVLKALLNDGVRVGISSRGVGNGKVNEDGILVIGESYKLITFDAVADPSTAQAFQEKVIAAKKEGYIPKENVNFNNNVTKNESRCIDNVLTKQMIQAAFSGIIQKQVNETKKSLKNNTF